MKKLSLTSLFLIISAASSSVLANAPNPAGGFTGPGAVQMPTTVAQVKNLKAFSDDIPVKLTGKITQSLGDELYTFQDSTGQITVEIDHDKWFGLQANPNTIVVINGELDNEFTGKKIDVDRILAK